MPDGNIFSDLIPASNSPGVIYGPAKAPDPVDPLEQRGKQLDIDLKEQRLRNGDPMGEGAAKLREGEQQAAFLTSNVLTNANLLSRAIKADPDAAAPTVGQEVAGIFGQTARNFASSAERQQAYAAQRLIVDNLLTLGTGAAYTSEQIDAYTRGFFPQLGDDPATVASKRESLRGAFAAARIKAGGAAGKIDEAMTQLGLSGTPLDVSPPPSPGTEPPGAAPRETTQRAQQSEADAGMIDMTAEQKAAYNAFWKANPNPTPEQLGQFFVQIGAAPEGTALGNASAIIEAVKEGAGYSTALDRTLVLRAEIERQKNIRGPAGFEGDSETLIKSGATLDLTDEASGLGRAASRLLQGRDPIEGYKLGRDAERLRRDDIRRQMGIPGIALEVGGGLLSANPTGALSALTGRQLLREGARGGAYGGALAGFGTGEGAQDSLTGAGVGATVGGIVGGALGGIASRTAPVPRDVVADADIAAAAAAEGVRVPEALVTGGRRAINRLGVLEANESTAPIIQQGLADTADDIGAGVQRLGRGGTAQDRAAGGEIVRQAAKDIKEADKAAATKAYEAAEAIDGDPMIDAPTVRAKLDAEIARLQRAPGSNEDAIRALQKTRRDFDGPLNLSTIRDIRTTLREGAATDLASSSGQRRAARRALGIIDGTKDDIKAGLSPEAWTAWQQADAMYSQQQDFIKTALRPFVGKDFDQLPAEQIFDRVRSAANSNGRALASLHRRLTPDQSRDIAATFADNLGRRGPDEDFSTALFVSQARKLSNSARETLFGPSGAASFNNLLRISRRAERFASQINQSRTARPVRDTIRKYANQFLLTALGGGGALAGGIPGAVAGATAATGIAATGAWRAGLSARALMRPAVTRWLERVSEVRTPQDARRVVDSLGVVIAREPALANELQPMQAWLQQAVTAPARSETPGGDNEQG